MAFGKFIIMMFAVIGLIDGSILALVFRKRRFYLWSLGGAIAGAIPAWYFNWYGLAYDSYGFWSLYLAYLLDGIMVACLIIPIPAFILGILSFIPGLRYFISNLGKGLIAIALVIGVYGCVMGNSREVVEYHDIYVKDLPTTYGTCRRSLRISRKQRSTSRTAFSTSGAIMSITGISRSLKRT